MISLRSQLRRKLLTYFYVNRSSRAYVRQLARELNVDSTNLSRELRRLEQEGFLQSEVEGRQSYYAINPRYPGLKPRHQLGHHIAIIEFAQKQFDKSHAATFVLFDRMRRKRNDAFYDIALISDTEAKEAVATAESYLKLVATGIKARLP